MINTFLEKNILINEKNGQLMHIILIDHCKKELLQFHIMILRKYPVGIK